MGNVIKYFCLPSSIPTKFLYTMNITILRDVKHVFLSISTSYIVGLVCNKCFITLYSEELAAYLDPNLGGLNPNRCPQLLVNYICSYICAIYVTYLEMFRIHSATCPGNLCLIKCWNISGHILIHSKNADIEWSYLLSYYHLTSTFTHIIHVITY